MGFEQVFKGDILLKGIAVPSGVAEQPMTDQETYQGALNRAKVALERMPDAAYTIGLEGGIEDSPNGMMSFAWAVILTTSGKVGKGRTASFFLPTKVAALVRQGKELGEADDLVFGETGSKQKMGAIGLLTKGLIDRTRLYQDAVVIALIPFINKMDF